MDEAPQLFDGLLFHTPSQERIKDMNIGEVVEYLIYIKSKYNVRFPDDNAINDACNILTRLPKQQDVVDWIIEHNKMD